MCESSPSSVIPAKAGIARGRGPGVRPWRSPLSRGRQVFISVAAILSSSIAFGGLSASQLLELADAPKRAFPEVVIHTRVVVTENGGSQVPAEFELYKKGDDRALVVFTAGKQKGRKILTVGEKFWILVPGASRPIPVTANQRLVGGASLGDIARLQFSREFDAVIEPDPETVAGLPCDVLDLKATNARSSYGSGRLWVDRKRHLARKAVLALVSGKPAKEILFERYGVENGKTVLLSMSVRDLLGGSAGAETRLEYSNYRILKIDDSFFTPEGALKF
ncbi:MAG: outer membrane lipoprotein-sorting protein [Thermoanaerobaculia bacterium]